MKNEGLADAGAANPFALPRLHPGIGLCVVAPAPEVTDHSITSGETSHRLRPGNRDRTASLWTTSVRAECPRTTGAIARQNGPEASQRALVAADVEDAVSERAPGAVELAGPRSSFRHRV